ncbi:Ankyrin-1 [Phytophthora nicotianae]|uniref:Ankyrin-1 n=1 Tax=Phytophthora nicotianae TaxID=4792 RepID=A0A0W8CZX4_PHYNI|nr:Ankyrin-1 [Phytophthora nicotianae]
MTGLIARVSPKHVPFTNSNKRGHGGVQKKRITGAQLFNLFRRIAGVAAALMYAGIGLQSAYTTIDVLQGTNVGTESFGTMEAKLIAGYCGDGLIRDSPLVKEVLGGDTSPRFDTLYLQSPTATSFENCGDIEMFNSDIYNATFLNSGFLGFIATSSYNLTIVQDLEFIVPVVDCTSPPLVTGDPSLLRVYNLVRRKSDPTDVHIVAISMSTQDYHVDEQSRRGPAILATLFSVSDMRATKVDQYFVLGLDYPYTSAPLFNVFTLDGVSPDGYWEMSSVPRNISVDPIIHARTARRRGFYLHAESEQANMRNLFWKVEDENPAVALSVWEWYGEPVIFDSWAWVHGIHLIFAWQTLFSLGVLSIVVFRNLRNGKIWIGDAFASVSNGTLMMRGLLVMASWYVNEYWTLVEFCLSNANTLSGSQTVPIHSELSHADLLVMFLSIIGLIGRFTRERIDPAFALFLFEIIHSNRLDIIRGSSSVMKAVVNYANTEYRAGIATVTDAQKALSPMRLWTTHMLNGIDFGFLAASLFPKVLLVVLILVYVGMRKVYHHFYPDQKPVGNTGRSTGDRSSNEKAATAQKGNLTNFEISTGAELEARYGLISDYKNYVFFKGLKFASADGVYCSGYVVANGRFLVGSKDLLSIIMIKALRSRFTNVYVYAVDGNTVQRTAQLVYPETLSWQDLIFLNINILA